MPSFIIGAVVSAVVTTAITAGISFLFGGTSGKSKASQPTFGELGESSPRYGFGALQNTISSELPVPIIYGEIKYGGNFLIQDPPEGGTTIHRALGLCVGEIDSIHDIRYNDMPVLSNGQFIGVDLGATGRKAIDSIKTTAIYPFNSFSIQASHDDISWEDISSGLTMANNTSEQTFTFTNSVAYRFWRLLGTGPGHHTTLVGFYSIKGFVGAGSDEFSGKTGIASVEDTDGGYTASKAFDGSSGTYWTYKVEVDSGNNFTIYKGDYTQGIDSRLTGKIEYAWRGTSYIACTIKANDKLQGDPTITGIIRGKKVKLWDSVNEVFTSTKYWSDNPAEIVRDFLTDTQFGVGIPEAQMDDESFGDVAEYCDELIDDNVGGKQRRYHISYCIDSRKPVIDILNEILPAFGAFLTESQGKYVLKIRRPESSVMAFDDGINGSNDNIVKGSFGYSKYSKDESANRIKMQYVDPDQNWTKVFAIAEDRIDQEARSANEGGDGIVTKEMQYLAITRFSQASRLAMMMLKELKYAPLTCTFRTTLTALPLDAGDIVTVSHSLPNWTSKPFRVLEVKEADNGEKELTCAEYNSSIYNDDYGTSIAFYDYGTPTNPYSPPKAPTAVTLTESGTVNSSGDWLGWIDVSWTASDASNVNFYEVEYDKDGAGYVKAGTTTGTSFRINGTTAPAVYTVRVRAVSTYSVTGAYGSSSPLSALGKLAPPSNVSGFSASFATDHVHFAWTPCTDADIYGYEIRQGASWNLGVVVATNITGNTYDFFSITAGTYTYWIKAIDTSGIYSTTAVSSSLIISGVPQSNVIVSFIDAMDGAISGDVEKVFTVDKWGYYAQAVEIKTSGVWDDGSWDGAEEWDDPYVATTGTYTSKVHDLGRVFNSNVTLELSTYNVSGGIITSEIAFSETDPDPSTFVPFASGQYSMRYFKIRFTLSTTDADQVVRLTSAKYSIDVPDLTQQANSVAVSSSGTTINLTGFYQLTSAVVTVVGATPLIPIITSQSASSFTVKLYNPATSAYDNGVINYSVSGY